MGRQVSMEMTLLNGQMPYKEQERHSDRLFAVEGPADASLLVIMIAWPGGLVGEGKRVHRHKHLISLRILFSLSPPSFVSSSSCFLFFLNILFFSSYTAQQHRALHERRVVS